MSEVQPKKPAGRPKPQKVKQPQKPAAQRQPAKQQQREQEEHEEEYGKSRLLSMAPSWLFSFVFHLVLILVLAFWLLPLLPEKDISFTSGTESGTMDDSIEVDMESLDSEFQEELESAAIQTDIQNEITEVSSTVELPATTELSDFGQQFSADQLATPNDVVIPSASGNELSGRGKDKRSQLAKANGASGESEESVDLALEWIVRHQLPDGSWSFDHTEGEGNFRKTSGPGSMSEAKIAATSLALLPLLGAGHTPDAGEHQEAVAKGFEYLKKMGQNRGKQGISYSEPGGDLYSHGLATIALCECFAMTYDKELEPYAQGAINFTMYAQANDGGWRYEPKEPGDTSAVGWQLMAYKSAKISSLETNEKTGRRANSFLDSVSDSQGSNYGYNRKPGRQSRPTLNSIGLLCRMYLGWKQDRPGLVDGMERISQRGPDTEYGINMYYNYYATQAMSHMYKGKPEWKKWNLEMRDFLVSTQAREGNKRGSWYYPDQNAQQVDRWSTAGGRLYDTAMSCMTLEVYYRFLPIYDSKATDQQFEIFE